MAKKKLMYGEEIEMSRIPEEDIKVNKTYLSYVGQLIKVLSYNESTNMLIVYNISESAKQYHDRKNVYFVKLIR